MNHDRHLKADVTVLVLNSNDSLSHLFETEMAKVLKVGLNDLGIREMTQRIKMYYSTIRGVLDFLRVEVKGLPCSKIRSSRSVAVFWKRNRA